MTFPGADTSRPSGNMAPGVPERESPRSRDSHNAEFKVVIKKGSLSAASTRHSERPGFQRGSSTPRARSCTGSLLWPWARVLTCQGRTPGTPFSKFGEGELTACEGSPSPAPSLRAARTGRARSPVSLLLKAQLQGERGPERTLPGHAGRSRGVRAAPKRAPHRSPRASAGPAGCALWFPPIMQTDPPLRASRAPITSADQGPNLAAHQVPARSPFLAGKPGLGAGKRTAPPMPESTSGSRPRPQDGFPVGAAAGEAGSQA